MALDTKREVDLEDGETAGDGEAVTDARLTDEERTRAERDSPREASDNRGLGDLDGNRTSGDSKSRGPAEP